MSPSVFPNLKQYIGQDLILTDGTTLLGGDDKGKYCSCHDVVGAFSKTSRNQT